MPSPAGLDEPAAPTAATLIGHDSLLVNRDASYYSNPCGKRGARPLGSGSGAHSGIGAVGGTRRGPGIPAAAACSGDDRGARRGTRRASEYLSLIHISEPTRRTPISYAVFCLKKKKKKNNLL